MPNVPANNISICYDSFGDKSKPPILLIGGLGWQMIAWEDAFCNQLAGEGFYVVRFDNRDAGLSTHLDDLGVPDLPALMADIRNNHELSVPYTLEDMAADGVGLMDALGFEKAHVCGISLGGMIAQCMAINFPHRISSLTSIGSTTGNPALPKPQGEVVAMAAAERINDRSSAIQRALDLNRMAGSPAFPTDPAHVIEKAGTAFDRAFNADGVNRQMAAVMANRDRNAKLRTLEIKALIVHGTSDPLVLPTDGIDTHESIMGSELLMIEGMGHELPQGAWSLIASAMREMIEKSTH